MKIFNSKINSSPKGFILAAVVTLVLHHEAKGAVTAVDLGTAAGFAVLAGAGITNTGLTTVTGDVGTFPTLSTAGFGTLILTINSINHGGNTVTQLAKNHLGNAYTDAAGRVPTVLLGPVSDLGGMTLGSGIYNGSSSLGITGTLILDALGDPDAVWIFQAGSTLITASNSTVLLLGGAKSSNVFWQVGSSATLGTGTEFAGSILASQSITLNTDSMIDGRALALHGAVTLDRNAVFIPEPDGFVLLSSCLVALFTRRRSGLGSDQVSASPQCQFTTKHFASDHNILPRKK